MSKGPENTFIASVHRHLPVDLYKIKNHNVFNSGQPDCWYSGPAGDLWIEYKFVVVPKRDDTPIVPNLSALQQEWLSRRHAEVSWQQPLTSKIYRTMIVTRATLASTIEQFIKG